MHEGVWKGQDAECYGVLLLGESHYDKDVHTEYDTKCVVCNYLSRQQETGRTFFDHITETFGYSVDDEEDKKTFWHKVWFGNYIDEKLLQYKDKAADMIRKNRKTYNDDLFEFVNKNEIRTVFCFSRLVWENLPTEKKLKTEKIGEMNNSPIEKCVYSKNTKYERTNVELKEDLTVYGLRHPSWCYSPGDAYEVLLKDEETHGLSVWPFSPYRTQK